MLGSVAALLTVDPGHEAAVAAALGVTAVTPEGIPIPFGVFPLARGERVFLHVLRFGTHRLFLFKDGSG